MPPIHRRLLVLAFLLLIPAPSQAQSDRRMLEPVLKEPILSPDVMVFHLRHYLLARIAKPPAASSASQWTAEAQRLRKDFLQTLFHGWPAQWVSAPLRFEDAGEIPGGKGYRMRRLRYEVVPGLWASAILYEPELMAGKVPAVLNVHGHVIPLGKATDYKQKRCINLAKRGVLALSLEWLGTGELNVPGNQHWYGAHLDLAGLHEMGLFYLQMRKGLDYLYQHPHTDQSRLGMTGLSGGGWQTIVLSALDERVKAAVPVAGFSSLQQRMEAHDFGSVGDVEQMATDVYAGRDYTHLSALLAPRPTLLPYNAEDDCCFPAALVKPLVFDAIRPFFKLYDREDALEWHENRDPGTHNYDLDNRQQAYRFFKRHFQLAGTEAEIDSDSEIKSLEELQVGLPSSNLTILGLARKLGREIRRAPVPDLGEARIRWAVAERAKLKAILRYQAASLVRPWGAATTKRKGVETRSYLFEMSNGLSANGVWLKAVASPETAPVTLVLDDRGKSAAGAEVAERVNRGEQVLALDLLFTGDAARVRDSETPDPGNRPWTPLATCIQVFHAVGERPLGLETAQLAELARWMRQRSGRGQVRLESRGIRSQVAALLAAALEPEMFSEVVVRDGMASLGYLLEKPVEFHQAADLFCLDLYKEFDIDSLAAMAEGARIVNTGLLTAGPGASEAPAGQK